MVALGRVVLAKRERVIMLQPWDKGLMGTTLRYAYEVRDTSDLFSGITDMKIAKDMLALAEHILETKAGEFDPENFHDRYEDAVVEMLQRKQAGMPAEVAKPAAPQGNVVSLMDALKKSLAAEDTKAPAAATGKAKKPSRKRAEGQREMLLPIAGKGAGKAEAAKPAAKAAPAKAGARQRKAG
jgi:DNA end-binding protein Ku